MFKYADYIYKIYEEQSFTQAAKKLFISQPALSLTVKKAEEELGYQIFDRGVSPLALTEAGKLYISALEEMQKLEHNLKSQIESIYDMTVGNVTVGGTSFVSSFILPKIIMEFKKEHPGVDITMTETHSFSLMEQLMSEDIDVLLEYNFDPQNFVTYPFIEERILLAVPRAMIPNLKAYDKALTVRDVCAGKHLSNDVGCVDLSKFKDEKFILLKIGNDMQKRCYKICGEYGFVPKPLISVDQLQTTYNIASSGMGITFATDTVIKNAHDSGNLLFYKLDTPFAKRTLYIGHKRKRNISPAVEAFISLAQKMYAAKEFENSGD